MPRRTRRQPTVHGGDLREQVLDSGVEVVEDGAYPTQLAQRRLSLREVAQRLPGFGDDLGDLLPLLA